MVFLWAIEYYQGVLILTSSLAHTIDEAFESRIDITLHYPELDIEVRICFEQFLTALQNERRHI